MVHQLQVLSHQEMFSAEQATVEEAECLIETRVLCGCQEPARTHRADQCISYHCSAFVGSGHLVLPISSN